MKILIVEDEKDILDLFGDLAEAYRTHEVSLYSDYNSAVMAIADHEFDLIISDLNLDSQKGIDLIEIANQRQPNARKILMTGDIEFKSNKVEVIFKLDVLNWFENILKAAI